MSDVRMTGMNDRGRGGRREKGGEGREEGGEGGVTKVKSE